MKRFIPLIVFIAFCGLLYVGLFMDSNTDLPSPLLDKPLPEFSASTLRNPEKTVTEKELAGQVFLLNVWGSWCPPCKIEHPYLVNLAKQGVNIIGVNYKDERDNALTWLERLGDPYQYNIVDAEGRFGINLGVYGAPETFLVDHNGVIRYKHVGIVDRQVWEDDFKPRYQALEKAMQEDVTQ